ncbi:MAG: hypothetical protein KDC46_04670, partial [Thermoleophilia bacterium]|nr:hypothetical protein [Thermoleophilia bacterium]
MESTDRPDMDAARSKPGTSFADDFDEFDHLLDDDDAPAQKTGRLPKVRAGAGAGGAAAKAKA